MIKAKSIVISLSLTLIGLSPLSPLPRVLAVEVVISGNGDASKNNVDVSAQSNTTITQQNTQEVQNNVFTNANTGSNTASNNNGDVAINTGNALSSVDVATQGNISGIDTSSCCVEKTTVSVEGNGSNTTNTAEIKRETVANTEVSQVTKVVNNISGTVNTGNNTASGNTGSVLIKTGSIHVAEEVKNGPLNVAMIKQASTSSLDKVLISGNGAGSQNQVLLASSEKKHISIFNTTSVFNNSFWNLISGNNSANYNNGDVAIITGDIFSTIHIDNGPINVGSVQDTCCVVRQENEDPKPTPTIPPPPQQDEHKPANGNNNNAGNGGSNSVGGVSAGSSLAAAIGKILPATGSNWLFFATLANIMLLFIGTVLRLRSGRSPGCRYNLAA